jgi:methylaspartate ammonia-lyase
MRIERAFAVPGVAGYYFDDLLAIQGGARQDGFFYVGTPSPGHLAVRQAGQSVCIALELDDGHVVWGDGVSIQYSGVVGRDPVLLASVYVPQFNEEIAPALVGLEVTTFQELSGLVEGLGDRDGRPFHTGLRYGASQALLGAVAHAKGELPVDTVAREWGSEIRDTPVPVLAQSGDDRFIGADKMILRSIPVITQGLFNTLEKVGSDGSRLLDYVSWLRERVSSFGADGYVPTFHLDVYGTVTAISDGNLHRATEYIARLEEAAGPYPLRLEHPLETGERDSLLTAMAELRRSLRAAGSAVEICADDWVNTLEDIRLCIEAEAADMIQIKAPDLGSLANSADAVMAAKAGGIKAFLGGTCNGTEQSAKMTVHVAMATNADQIYNKPGMGVDEGFLIASNEMTRILALRGARTATVA